MDSEIIPPKMGMRRAMAGSTVLCWSPWQQRENSRKDKPATYDWRWTFGRTGTCSGSEQARQTGPTACEIVPVARRRPRSAGILRTIRFVVSGGRMAPPAQGLWLLSPLRRICAVRARRPQAGSVRARAADALTVQQSKVRMVGALLESRLSKSLVGVSRIVQSFSSVDWVDSRARLRGFASNSNLEASEEVFEVPIHLPRGAGMVSSQSLIP